MKKKKKLLLILYSGANVLHYKVYASNTQKVLLREAIGMSKVHLVLSKLHKFKAD